MFGDQEDCSVLIRCVPDKKMASVVVAGPNSDQADRPVTDVAGAYRDR